MRILVTRPREQGEATAARLAALGHEALAAPLLTIARTDETPPAGPFDALIVTSANAVPALAGFDKTLPVFAVGERTAALVRAAGFANAGAAAGDGASLAALAASSLPPGARLLHAAGRDRKPEPRASLVRAGFAVETFAAYEAVAATELPESLSRALREGALDGALHYSRRTVEIAIGLASAAGFMESFLSLRHLCLSADVASPLREEGAARLIVAGEPDEASLLAALALCDSSS
jgi:uroporphyrinogen-III synthase